MVFNMTNIPEIECVTRGQWRAWMVQNHTTASSVWLITFKKAVADKYIAYEETVEEALCFGWVDSKPGKVDADRCKLYFTPRKPTVRGPSRTRSALRN